MFCTNCGAPLQEGVKFCTNCGVKVQASAPAAQPIEQSAVQPTVKPTAQQRPARRPRLIVPAIFAALAAVLFAIVWSISLYTALPNLTAFGRNLLMLLTMAREILYPLCLTAAAVLAFLFCILQHKRGKPSLFALSCLMLVLYFGLSLLVQGLSLIQYGSHTRAVQIHGIGLADAGQRLSLYGAGFVLFLIEMIGAFRGKVNRVIGILAGVALMLSCGAVYSEFDRSIRNTVELFGPILLGVAMLLIAILWRPKKEAE